MMEIETPSLVPKKTKRIQVLQISHQPCEVRDMLAKLMKPHALFGHATIEPTATGWVAQCLETGGIAAGATVGWVIESIIDQTGQFLIDELGAGRSVPNNAAAYDDIERWSNLAAQGAPVRLTKDVTQKAEELREPLVIEFTLIVDETRIERPLVTAYHKQATYTTLAG